MPQTRRRWHWSPPSEKGHNDNRTTSKGNGRASLVHRFLEEVEGENENGTPLEDLFPPAYTAYIEQQLRQREDVGWHEAEQTILDYHHNGGALFDTFRNELTKT